MTDKLNNTAYFIYYCIRVLQYLMLTVKHCCRQLRLVVQAELQVGHICSSSGRLGRLYTELYQAKTPQDSAKLVLTDVCLPSHACFDRLSIALLFENFSAPLVHFSVPLVHFFQHPNTVILYKLP